jgi:YegS/Rv2252/BmrU family lipid kinase
VNRAFVIVNPVAGRGTGSGLERPIAETARRLGWEVVVRATRRAGQERELAAHARSTGWPVVVAVGGDGTVHETVNGLLAEGPTSAVLGHVPVGSGNDYARALGLRPAPIPDNLERVLRGRRTAFDVGRAAGEYFVNGMGAGFDAEVVRQTLRMNRLTGFPLYLAAVLKTFRAFEAPELEIDAQEHRERERMMMCNVSIGLTQGGGFRLSPDAQPDDGFLHVCLIRRVGLLKFLRYLPRVIRGTHGALPEVTLFRSERVTVTGVSSRLAVQLDGELRYPDEPAVEVRVLPRYLHVLCAA